ncbi:unnamed protein product [Nesidiocoris tenuis]|uniref:Uncharacterized protein n=1 Tax=Nesidiocoris tenuis TaxID=355587 RepID=A0A6H5HF27_9HEMI|nr:unnamed protein product [Nesidiocoris tenuis]
MDHIEAETVVLKRFRRNGFRGTRSGLPLTQCRPPRLRQSQPRQSSLPTGSTEWTRASAAATSESLMMNSPRFDLPEFIVWPLDMKDRVTRADRASICLPASSVKVSSIFGSPIGSRKSGVNHMERYTSHIQCLMPETEITNFINNYPTSSCNNRMSNLVLRNLLARLHRADTFPCSGGHHSIDMIHRVLIRKTRMGGDDNSEDVDEGSRKGTKDCSVMAENVKDKRHCSYCGIRELCDTAFKIGKFEGAVLQITFCATDD